MWRKDYFLRMVEQLGQVLTHVLKLSDTRDYKEAEVLIDQATRELIGLDMEPLLQLSDEDIINLLQRNTATITWAEKGVVLAALLNMDAQLKENQAAEGASYIRNLKALNLLVATADEAVEEMDDVPTVVELTKQLANYVLPDITYQNVINYFENEGRFAKAEDILYEWLEGVDGNLNAIEHGLAFYGRLQQQPDAVLEAGDLPREEVTASLTDLQARYEAFDDA